MYVTGLCRTNAVVEDILNKRIKETGELFLGQLDNFLAQNVQSRTNTFVFESQTNRLKLVVEWDRRGTRLLSITNPF